MRLVRYNVAASLDGYIATTDGAYDWIPSDATVDFGALFANVDTVLVGRRTWEVVARSAVRPWAPNSRVYVFSSTLTAASAPDATVVTSNAERVVDALRNEPGDGDIWLFGGGELFRRMLMAGQVDRVEVTVVPILLGGGVALSPMGSPRTPLALIAEKRYPSGMVALSYNVAARGR